MSKRAPRKPGPYTEDDRIRLLRAAENFMGRYYYLWRLVHARPHEMPLWGQLEWALSTSGDTHTLYLWRQCYARAIWCCDCHDHRTVVPMGWRCKQCRVIDSYAHGSVPPTLPGLEYWASTMEGLERS